MEAPGHDSTPSPELDTATAVLRQRIIDETRRRTGKTPYEWQIQNTLDRLAGKDTFVVAGTGAGKSLTFGMVPFMVPKSITWILAPLNYIEEQLVKDMEGWRVSAVAINQNSNWEVEKQKILKRRYQVVISSPEAFLSVDRLRNVVMSEELEEYQHFGIVDEAHVIHTWGANFRKDYGRVGNLRGILYNIPFSAVTATATDAIKKSIVECLHLGQQRELAEINLGNFRPNIEYSVHRMKGGGESYEELFQFFPDRNNIRPTLIFVDKTQDAHVIAAKLRDFLGLTGTPEWDKVRPYHANRAQSGKDQCAEDFKNGKCVILISTEALTMGANFLKIELVIQFPAPNSIVTHVQRIGRGARSPNIRCRGIMMVTPHQYQRALELSTHVKDMQPDDLLNAKVEEEDLDELEGVMGGAELGADNNNGALDESSGAAPKTFGKTSLRAINLHVARFITTQTCRVKVLDHVFKNPEHISCYEAGTCDLCVARRARDEVVDEVDTHTEGRAAKREEIEVELYARGEEINEPRRKRATRVDNRTGKELQRFVDVLKKWRRQTFKTGAETGQIGLEDVMTDKALESIAKSKQIKDVTALDGLEPLWPQRNRWGEEVVGIVLELAGTIEEERRQVAEEEQRRKEEARREREAQRQAVREAKQAEKEAQKLARQQECKARQTSNAPSYTPTAMSDRPSTSNQAQMDPPGPSIIAQTPARVVIGPDGRPKAIFTMPIVTKTPTNQHSNQSTHIQHPPMPYTPPRPQSPPFIHPVVYATPNSYQNPNYATQTPIPFIPRPLPFAYGAPYATPVSAPRVSHPLTYPQPGPPYQPPGQSMGPPMGQYFPNSHSYYPSHTHTPQTPTVPGRPILYQHSHSPNNTYRIPAPQFQPATHPPLPPQPQWFPPHPPSGQ